MTLTHIEKGYLETGYLDEPYAGQYVDGYAGQQATFTITKNSAYGMQCKIVIVDRQQPYGQQANFVIADSKFTKGQQALFALEHPAAYGQQAFVDLTHSNEEGQQALFALEHPAAYGQQANYSISSGKQEHGLQSKFNITNAPKVVGQQAYFHINDKLTAFGMQYKRDFLAHLTCGDGYLADDYLSEGYLLPEMCAFGGMQTDIILYKDLAKGMQTEIHINDHLKAYGQQALINIVNHLVELGQQVEIIQQLTVGMQARIALYNTDHLRILCEFQSRGLSTATGTNAWGNPAGQGENWKSNSTESGDFSPFNLNTDIVEQVWRSNAPTTSGISLDCDTERPQGVFLDTLAILNHNITTSATVTLIGSNTPLFTTIGVSIPLEVLKDEPNMYYISPLLPTAGYRYWRISIDDASNPDGYVEIGTIVFGVSNIFIGEAFVDQVEFQLKDFTDSVQTEGFTNVNNSRAQKKMLRLDFRSLAYLRANFKMLRSMFKHERTVLKCLWIPTPDPDNQEYTARFAVFSKLAQIPNETHNHKGGDADYVTFQIELDESR